MKRVLVWVDGYCDVIKRCLPGCMVVEVSEIGNEIACDEWTLMVVDIDRVGLDNLEKLAKICPAVPLMVIGKRKGIAGEVLKKGGTWYMRKPIKEREFRELVKNLLL